MQERTSAERQQRLFQQKTQTYHWRRRIDIMLIVFLLGTLITLIGSWWFGVRTAERLGVFDDPPIQELADDRLRVGQNIRDSLPEQSLLDAIFHAPDRLVYISQEGGTIHTYDPATRLWGREETGFTEDEPINTDFVQLRSGCGSDPLSNYVDQCAEPDVLWAVSADGGLARRADDGWEIVVNNTRFVGANGEPVETDELTTAAVSADQQWLLLGTRDNGIGLYHTQRQEWIQLSAEIQESLPALAISHIIWWEDMFWVGSAVGLAQVIPQTGQPTVQPVEAIKGTIVDLDADEKLWVLERRDCVETEGDCLWLGHFDQPNDTPTVLIDQQNFYPQVNLADLHYAQQWGDTLALAGRAGIYLYDTQYHRWQQLFEDPVFATLAFEDSFYFSSGRDVQRVNATGEIDKDWTLPAPVQYLLYDDNQKLLAFSETGGLYRLLGEEEVATIYEPEQTTFAPDSFRSATTIGDTVLFIGSDGALLHNTVDRRYADLAADLLPDWMKEDDVQLINVDDTVYGLTQSGSNLTVYIAPTSDMVNPDFYISRDIRAVEPVLVPGPAQAVWRWGMDGIGILAKDGDVYQVGAELARVTDSAETNLTTLVDVAQTTNQLYVATDDTIRTYDLHTHSWQTEATHEEKIEEIQLVDGQLVWRSDGAQLLTLAGDALIGDIEGFLTDDDDLTDALALDAAFYLAGAGRVERYDSDQRAIAQRWEMATSGGDVQLITVLDGQPLTQVGDRAFLGETALLPNEGAVQTLSFDNTTIWTVREQSGERFLMGHARNNINQTTCYFRNPTAGNSVSTVHDALELPDGVVAVATNVGVRFYNPQARSWYAAAQGSLIANRLHIVDDHLVLIAGEPLEASFRIGFVPLNNIRIPTSCADDVVALSADPVAARSVAVNDQKVAWIDTSGRVIEWDGNSRTTILERSETTPSQSQLRRLFDRGRYWLFTTDAGLWRYDTELRFWERITLSQVSGTIREINIEQSGGENTLLVMMSDAFFIGTFETEDDVVVLERIQPDAGTAGFSADNLLDVQLRSTSSPTWTFVLNDHIRYFDPVDRSWDSSATVPSDPNYTFQEILGRGILVSGDNQTWHIATSIEPHPSNFSTYTFDKDDQSVAIAHNGDIYRISRAGELLLCQADDGSYPCEVEYEPLLIDSVEQAFEWEGHVLLRSPAGFRAFDIESGTEQPIELATMGHVSATYSGTEQLLLFSEAEQQVAIIDDSLQTTLVAAERFFEDANGTLWIEANGDWSYFAGNQFVPLETEAQPFILPHSAVAALDADRVPYWWIANQLDSADLPLPAEFNPDEVTWLQSVNATDWWVLQADRLAYVDLTQCALPVPTPTPTAVITSTQVPTATLTPEPSPTPQLVSCYQTTGSVDVGITSLAGAIANEDGSIDLIATDGTAVRVDTNLTVTSSNAVLTPMPLANEWPQLESNLVELPSGETAYDPFVQLTLNGSQLVAERPSGEQEVLSEGGALPTSLSHPDALDVDWFSWDRANDQFMVRTPSGTETYTPAQFIRDEALLFEPIGALLAKSRGEIYAANQYGVWQHGQTDLALNDTSIRFSPQVLSEPIVAVHGQLLAGTRAYAVSTTGINSQTAQNTSVSNGDVSLEEDVRQANVSGEVLVNGSAENAFASTGFIWDANREGVGYAGSDLLLQSDAGIHPTDRLSDFDAGPSEGVLIDEDGNVYLFDNPQWYHRDGVGQWQIVTQDPLRNRTLLDNPIWKWELDDGELAIELDDSTSQTYQFDFTVTNLQFTADQLQAAAAFDNQLFVATDAFLEVDQPQRFPNWQASRLDPITTDAFWPVRFATGSPRLFNYAGNNITEWDGNGFRSFNGADPLQNRQIVASNRLRFTLDNGTVVKEIQLDNFSAGTAWVEFNFVNRQFPFDVVTSLAEFDGDLFVGSAAGLQQYTGASTALSDMQNLFDLRAGDAELTAVTRLGIPEQAPDQLQVETNDNCWGRQVGTGFAPCEEALLDRRLRVQNSFWQWVDAETLIGQYHLANGRLASTEIEIVDGRFPHDTLTQITVCAGQLFSLWQAGWITAFANADLTIDAQTDNFAFSADLPQRLICIDRTITLANGESLEQGAYYEDENGAVFFFANNKWFEVDEESLQMGVKDFADFPLILLEDRYRLRTPRDESALTFEWRTLQREWQPLDWVQDESTEGWYVPTDSWHNAHFVDDQLWAASDAGLVTFEYDGDEATLNRDQIVVVREPETPCHLTDMQTDADATWVRCEASSSRVYSGTLTTTQDRNVFNISAVDPFAAFDVSQAPYWQWRVIERVDGNAGALAATWADEPVTLLTGQFEFDGLNSLTLFMTDTVDIATDLGGWYRLPRTTAHIDSFVRSDLVREPTAILQVRHTVSDGDDWLCLRTNDGFRRIALDETSDSATVCPEYAGFDGLWQYESDEGQLWSYAPAGIGGRGTRELITGRFGDDIVVGLPIVQALGEGETRRYFLPSAAGVLELDDALTTAQIHVPPFAGLPANSVPTALWLSQTDPDPAYLGAGSMHTLDANGVRPTLTESLQELVGVTINSVEDGPQEMVRVNWQIGNTNQWTLIDRTTMTSDTFTRYENSLFVDLQPFGRFTQQRLAWDNPTGWMGLTFQPREVQVWFGEAEANSYRLREEFVMIRPIQYNDRLLLFGTQALEVVDLESVMLDSFPEDPSTLTTNYPYQPVVIGSTVQLEDLHPLHQEHYNTVQGMAGTDAERALLYTLTGQLTLLPGFNFGADSSLLVRDAGRVEEDVAQINQVVSVEDQLRAGIFFSEQAYHIARQSDNPALLAYGLSILSVGYAQRGNLAEADKAYHQARQLAQQFAPELESVVLMNGITVRLGHQDYEGAIALSRDTLTLAQSEENRQMEAGVHLTEGLVHMTEQRFQDAIAAYEQVRLLEADLDDAQEMGMMLTSLGFAYQVINERTEALEAFNDALDIAQSDGVCIFEALMLNNVAFALQDALPLTNVEGADDLTAESADLETALNYIDEALDKMDTQRETCVTEHIREEYVDGLIGLLFNTKGFILSRKGEYQLAAEQYEQGLVYAERAEEDTVADLAILNNHFNMLLTMPQPRPAEARAMIEPDGDGGWRFKAAHKPFVIDVNLGLLAELEGDIPSAIQFYRDAIDNFERIQSGLSAEQLKVAFSDATIDVHKRLFLLLWETEQYEAAFAVTEQARARAFLDQFANRDVSNYLDELPTEILNELDGLYTQRINSYTDATIDRVQIEKEIQNVIERMQTISPRDASLVSITPPSLEAIQAELDTDTTLISYFTTDDATFAFLITKDNFEPIKLKDASAMEIDAIVNRVDLIVAAPVDSADTSTLNVAYDVLIADLPTISTAHVIIVPHQQLHYLPFAALKSDSGWLSEQYTLSYLPSASTLLYIDETDEVRANEPLLAFGNPTSAQGNLPGAEAEAEAVANHFDGTWLAGSSATETDFYNNAHQNQIIHLAAHGRYNRHAPLLSTIYLAEDDIHDGYLEAHEIYELDLVAELVVLSACQTQVSDSLSAGDEITALNRAFLYAGADAVIATLWNVDDRASSGLMQAFYAELDGGAVDYATALQRAQATVREKHPNNPYYWAGYTLTANGTLSSSNSLWDFFRNR